MNPAEEEGAVAATRPTEPAGVKPKDALDEALREAGMQQREMSFDSFVQSLRMTWPTTWAGRIGVVVLSVFVVAMLASGRGDVATMAFGLLLWILGVQKEQRITLGIVFGATQQVVRQGIHAQHAAFHQGQSIAELGQQVDRVQQGVDAIRADPNLPGSPPNSA